MNNTARGIFQYRIKTPHWNPCHLWVDVASKYDEVVELPSQLLMALNDHRGFPTDDFLVDAEGNHNGRWMGAHSHSWLSADEILNSERPADMGEFEFHDFMDEVRKLWAAHRDLRFVFGFNP